MAKESSFAQKQLYKHGWTEGSGLGKNESGIKEAIKVKVKQDSHGIGHRQGDEFTFHWWDHVFNKAASNISVNVEQDSVSLSKTSENGPISNKKTKTFDNKDMLYGKFVKSALLSNGKIEKCGDQDSDLDSDLEDVIGRPDQLNDEELLKVCGGLTGHKAARHGHGLNGKLLRVQEQERQEFDRLQAKLSKKRSKHKKSKRETTLDTPDDENCSSDGASVNKTVDFSKIEMENNKSCDVSGTKKKKKSKKKKKEIDDKGQTVEIDASDVNSECAGDTDIPVKSKKKKRKNEKCSKGDNSGDEISKKRKKMKTKENEMCDNEKQTRERKKSKKKKKHKK